MRFGASKNFLCVLCVLCGSSFFASALDRDLLQNSAVTRRAETKRAAAALGGKAGLFVQHDGGRVAMDDHAVSQLQLRFGQRLARLEAGAAKAAFDVAIARRHAQNLPLAQPVFRRGAFAIDADLPGARPAADRRKADLWQMALEPAVQPYVIIIAFDGELTDFIRGRVLAGGVFVIAHIGPVSLPSASGTGPRTMRQIPPQD